MKASQSLKFELAFFFKEISSFTLLHTIHNDKISLETDVLLIFTDEKCACLRFENLRLNTYANRPFRIKRY